MLVFLCNRCAAQNDSIPPLGKDSVHAISADSVHPVNKNNIFNYALGFIRKNGPDTLNQEGVLIAKSENIYKQYEGKIIRNIVISQFRFEKTFNDTVNTIKYFGTRILNSLHNTTKEWVLENSLFIKPGEPVIPSVLADNERYLRTLDYIQDARIIVQPKTGSPDSVDVYVITKDLFSINGQLQNLSPGIFKGTIEDANLFGIGQKLSLTYLWEKKRDPESGYSITYTKENVAHSFIDASVMYSTINPDLRNNSNDEKAFVFSLQRNLISQYTHVAGGFEWGDFQTYNNYNRPEHDFYNYHYQLFDTWMGYNLGVKNYITDKSNSKRTFVALRYYKTNFIEEPNQVGNKLFFRFNDKEAILGQITFFKQDYYKANYIYGFGITEDIPVGYNISFTGGWYEQSYLSRPYAGVDVNRYVVYNKGNIVQYFIRAGSFYNHGQFQDAGVLAGIAGYSGVMTLKNFKLREYFKLSYGNILNRTGLEPLEINNPFGIRNFNRDSVMGNQRISLQTETISYINYRIFGFKLSPFLFGDVSRITPNLDDPYRPSWFYGLGGGLRVKNENLVFNTIELRGAYFPNTVYGMKHFYGEIEVNIQFRFNSNYVTKPEIIQFNSDVHNNIF